MVSQAELKKRRVKATKEQTRQEQVVDRRDRRRRLGVSAFILVLALALIAPLAAGLFASLDDDSSTIDTSTPVELDATPPSLVDPGFEGASLTGPTPCPATDGTQQRVTSFEAAPVGCIDPVASYTVDLATVAGSVAIDLDVGSAPEATNLFVSLARYGVYEGARIQTEFDGLVVLGNFGDAGFSVPATEAPAGAAYPVGTIALLTELGSGAMTGQAVIVTSELGAELLASDGTSPVIGSVAGGMDVLAALAQLADDNPGATYRIRSATVTEASS